MSELSVEIRRIANGYIVQGFDESKPEPVGEERFVEDFHAAVNLAADCLGAKYACAVFTTATPSPPFDVTFTGPDAFNTDTATACYPVEERCCVSGSLKACHESLDASNDCEK